MVIFLFLRKIPATLVPAVAVPLSILTTYGGMALLGFSINNISLLALTLCVGFVVDDAIVMLENIVRYTEKGMKPFEAALKGSKEIGFTIISITLSFIAVFIPLLFMGGVVGRLFREFAMTISFAILVSAVISLTLTPMLCSRFLGTNSTSKKESPFSRFLEASFQKMFSAYEYTLQIVLQNQFKTLLFTLCTLLMTTLMYIYVPKGFFPIEDTGILLIQTEASPDISFSSMAEKQQQVADIIKQDPAVDKYFSSVGGGRTPLNMGRLSVSLLPPDQRPSVFTVTQSLRKKLAQVQGIKTYLQPIQNISVGGSLSKSLYQYTMQGTDLNQLYQWSETMREALTKAPGLQDVASDLQLKSLKTVVTLDQEHAASLGITYENVRQALYDAFGISQVGTLYTPADQYEIILEFDPKDQKSAKDLKDIYVKNANGALVPLETIAQFSTAVTPLSVNHVGQLPSVTLSFNLESGYSLGTSVDEIKRLEEDLKVPSTITTGFQGTAKVFAESLKGQLVLLLLAILVIYAILGMLYESFIHPLTILSGLRQPG